jgi:hypothetical protein
LCRAGKDGEGHTQGLRNGQTRLDHSYPRHQTPGEYAGCGWHQIIETIFERLAFSTGAWPPLHEKKSGTKNKQIAEMKPKRYYALLSIYLTVPAGSGR